MSEDPIYCCKTCKAIWYDGTTDSDEIKRHSLQWPVDHIGAYVKADYGAEEAKTHE